MTVLPRKTVLLLNRWMRDMQNVRWKYNRTISMQRARSWGGAIFTLADFAFAVASNWNKPLHVSTTSQITYLGVARGARLIAEAHKVKEGRSTCYYLVDVKDDLGNEVAHVTSSGFSKG